MENYTSRKMTREEIKVSDATAAQLVLNKSLRDFKKHSFYCKLISR
ncbi:hypothetical protein MUB15_03105 [Priestia sp. OVS21]|nr:hypothetical protein [Priestia sp. OVS21]